MNPTSVYKRTIRHLQYRFKTFDRDLVDARLEKYGIIADYKIMRKIEISLIINAQLLKIHISSRVFLTEKIPNSLHLRIEESRREW